MINIHSIREHKEIKCWAGVYLNIIKELSNKKDCKTALNIIKQMARKDLLNNDVRQ